MTPNEWMSEVLRATDGLRMEMVARIEVTAREMLTVKQEIARILPVVYSAHQGMAVQIGGIRLDVADPPAPPLAAEQSALRLRWLMLESAKVSA